MHHRRCTSVAANDRREAQPVGCASECSSCRILIWNVTFLWLTKISGRVMPGPKWLWLKPAAKPPKSFTPSKIDWRSYPISLGCAWKNALKHFRSVKMQPSIGPVRIPSTVQDAQIDDAGMQMLQDSSHCQNIFVLRTAPIPGLAIPLPGWLRGTTQSKPRDPKKGTAYAKIERIVTVLHPVGSFW